jgi:hypothetical protein
MPILSSCTTEWGFERSVTVAEMRIGVKRCENRRIQGGKHPDGNYANIERVSLKMEMKKNRGRCSASPRSRKERKKELTRQ